MYPAQQELTILRDREPPAIGPADTHSDPHSDPHSLALAALGWVLAEEDRAQRLLDLTGLEPADLRDGLADPAIMASVLEFLSGHEPDLLACADALEMDPARIIAAKEELAR